MTRPHIVTPVTLATFATFFIRGLSLGRGIIGKRIGDIVPDWSLFRAGVPKSAVVVDFSFTAGGMHLLEVAHRPLPIPPKEGE